MSLGSLPPEALAALATSLYRSGRFAECEELAHHMLELTTAPPQVRAVGHLGMARALVSRQRYDQALEHAQAVSEFAPPHDIASDLVETMACIVAQRTPPIETSSETSAERQAFAHLEAGNFTPLVAEVSNPSWPIVRAALAACEFRTEAEHAIPVSPRALEAASAVLARSRGATTTDEALARIHALRIRENAYIQVDPPPPLGQRYSAEEFERLHGERNQRPRRPSGLLRFAR